MASFGVLYREHLGTEGGQTEAEPPHHKSLIIPINNVAHLYHSSAERPLCLQRSAVQVSSKRKLYSCWLQWCCSHGGGQESSDSLCRDQYYYRCVLLAFRNRLEKKVC